MEYSLPIVLYGNILIPRLHHLFVKVEAEVEHLPFLNGGGGGVCRCTFPVLFYGICKLLHSDSHHLSHFHVFSHGGVGMMYF